MDSEPTLRQLKRLSNSQLNALSAIASKAVFSSIKRGVLETTLYNGWHLTARTIASLEKRGFIERPDPNIPKLIRLTAEGVVMVDAILLYEEDLF